MSSSFTFLNALPIIMVATKKTSKPWEPSPYYICYRYRYSRICIRHAPWCAHLAPSWPQPATAGPRHPPASIPRSQADQTGAGTGGTAGTAGPEPDVVEVEPSSKAKSIKWSEGRLVVLYAGPCTLLARSACVLWLGG